MLRMSEREESEMESNSRLENFGVGDSEEDLMRAFKVWFSKLIQELESSSKVKMKRTPLGLLMTTLETPSIFFKPSLLKAIHQSSTVHVSSSVVREERDQGVVVGVKTHLYEP